MSHIPTRRRDDSRPIRALRPSGYEGEFLLGQVLQDQYEIFEVNEGGFGYVLGVKDLRTDGDLALKIQKSSTQDASLSFEEFASEVSFWVNLDAHPNIVTAHGVQEIEGRPTLLLEYVEGAGLKTLRDWLDSGRVNREHALGFAHQLCTAMQFANRNSEIAHLDLKPENLLIDREAVLKVTDFGLAHRVRMVNQAYPRRSAASWPYAAPEQFRSEVCDTRSDLFSFGIIVYEMLYGKLPYPFEIDSESERAWRQLEDFHRVHGMGEITREVYYGKEERELATVLSGCLASIQSERPRDFSMALEVLERCPGVPERASSKTSVKPEETLARAVALRRVGRYSECLTRINRLLIEDSENALYWWEAALTLEAQGDLGTSEEFRAKALRLDPAIERRAQRIE
jgi:serine/threonine protein kinase